MRLACMAALLLACGGSGHGGGTRDYPEPSVKDVLDRIAKARGELTSFKADSTMDYWIGGQRAKGEVLVMGKVGAKIRFAALSPAGGSTLAEMACDGTHFVYVDYQNNCALSGPCDEHSIEQFFRIALQPDDFLHLALGTPPTLGDATGAVTWDGGNGVERVELKAAEGTQKLTLDGKAQHWDVLDTELTGSDGKVRWSVANTSFDKVKGSGDHRVPGKTRFKSPVNSQDLLVQWGEREVNVALDDSKFALAAPAGLAVCGQKAAAAGAAPRKP